MQDKLHQIFETAKSELPDRFQSFHNEDAILYRGFKISKNKEGYHWQDTRYSDFYEVVSPEITKNVLERGFTVTLNEVMLHNDKEKVLNLSREIEKKDAIINHWAKESTKLWANYNRKKSNINKDETLTDEDKELKRSTLKKRYEKNKSLYQKKRRVITEEREDIKNDIKFFESRIKLYNKLKP